MTANLQVVPISRREALREGIFSAAGVLLGSRLAAAAPAVAVPAKAKSVIQIWMWGGPAHLDTFDPKPDAGENYCGPLNSFMETNISGIRICELLPLLARQADKYSLIRSIPTAFTHMRPQPIPCRPAAFPAGTTFIRAWAPSCRSSRAITPVTRGTFRHI
jgi:Protein of unknown function (DUF1501)